MLSTHNEVIPKNWSFLTAPSRESQRKSIQFLLCLNQTHQPSDVMFILLDSKIPQWDNYRQNGKNTPRSQNHLMMPWHLTLPSSFHSQPEDIETVMSLRGEDLIEKTSWDQTDGVDPACSVLEGPHLCPLALPSQLPTVIVLPPIICVLVWTEVLGYLLISKDRRLSLSGKAHNLEACISGPEWVWLASSLSQSLRHLKQQLLCVGTGSAASAWPGNFLEMPMYTAGLLV